MDIQILLKKESDLKEQLVRMTQKLDELYKIKEQSIIDLREYCYDNGNPLEGLLFTPEYDRLFCRLNNARGDILAYEKIEDMLELQYLSLSTNLRKLGIKPI